MIKLIFQPLYNRTIFLNNTNRSDCFLSRRIISRESLITRQSASDKHNLINLTPCHRKGRRPGYGNIPSSTLFNFKGSVPQGAFSSTRNLPDTASNLPLDSAVGPLCSSACFVDTRACFSAQDYCTIRTHIII